MPEFDGFDTTVEPTTRVGLLQARQQMLYSGSMSTMIVVFWRHDAVLQKIRGTALELLRRGMGLDSERKSLPKSPSSKVRRMSFDFAGLGLDFDRRQFELDW